MKITKLISISIIVVSFPFWICVASEDINQGDLVGKWRSSSALAGSWTFTETTFTVERENSIGSSSGDHWPFKYTNSGRYIVTPTGGNDMIDLIYDVGSVTATTEKTVEYFKRIKMCDFSDWKLGVAHVTYKKCFNAPDYPTGTIRYTIYSAEENRLRFGRYDFPYCGGSPEERPIELTKSFYTLEP